MPFRSEQPCTEIVAAQLSSALIRGVGLKPFRTVTNGDDSIMFICIKDRVDVEIDLRRGLAKGLTNALTAEAIKQQPIAASVIVNLTSEQLKKSQRFTWDASLLLALGRVSRRMEC